MNNKKQIRQVIKKERASLSLKSVQEQSDQIISKICTLPIFQTASTILVYSSIGNEVDTSKILQVALANNKQVAYPSTNTGNNTMEFYKVSAVSDLKPVKSGSFSLLEPVPHPSTKVTPDENTLMIVPGLAFDQHFYRTGYGGGFYDKYLALHPSLTTIGVCYDFQLIPSTYPNEYDQPVGSIMTPTKYYEVVLPH